MQMLEVSRDEAAQGAQAVPPTEAPTVFGLLNAGVSPTLLLDMVEPAGPDSWWILTSEPAGT